MYFIVSNYGPDVQDNITYGLSVIQLNKSTNIMIWLFYVPSGYRKKFKYETFESIILDGIKKTKKYNKCKKIMYLWMGDFNVNVDYEYKKKDSKNKVMMINKMKNKYSMNKKIGLYLFFEHGADI